MATQPNRSADGREAIQMPIEDACKGQMVSRTVAHQCQIRDQHALEVDPLLEDKKRLASSLKNAWVREISRAEAETIILKYEWLKSMGTTDYQFGLYFGEHLAGVVCFGRTAGTKTAESVCGKEHAHLVKTLNRGACVHWAHPHAASFLISHACRLMADKGFHILLLTATKRRARSARSIRQAIGCTADLRTALLACSFGLANLCPIPVRTAGQGTNA